MKTVHFQQVAETLYYEKLANGLDVYLLPKVDFNKTYATFTTKYGSIDNQFIPLGKSEAITVPDGIAHFLEHKMFEDETGDVFQVFGKQGASANAFTSFTRTAYLFSSTSQVEKNLTTLLDFVQHPYFTDQSVEKEKGIIGQEIKMYDDNPDWRVYYGAIESMYEHHPVRIDIAGTIESIGKITKEMLYTCYETFYHPSNMLLFVVGPIDVEKTMELIKENQGRKTFAAIEPLQRFFPAEPNDVASHFKQIEMSVNTPKVIAGFKEAAPYRQGKQLLERELGLNLLLDLMFGQSSANYEKLYNLGLIDETFSFDYTGEYGFGFSLLGGDTKKPKELIETMKEMIATFVDKPLPNDEVETIRRKKIGAFLRSLNSPEFIANQFTRYQFNEMSLFDVVPTLEQLTVDSLTEMMHDHFQFERFTASVVQKKGYEEEKQ